MANLETLNHTQREEMDGHVISAVVMSAAALLLSFTVATGGYVAHELNNFKTAQLSVDPLDLRGNSPTDQK